MFNINLIIKSKVKVLFQIKLITSLRKWTFHLSTWSQQSSYSSGKLSSCKWVSWLSYYTWLSALPHKGKERHRAKIYAFVVFLQFKLNDSGIPIIHSKCTTLQNNAALLSRTWTLNMFKVQDSLWHFSKLLIQLIFYGCLSQCSEYHLYTTKLLLASWNNVY